jgi:hypothetical protein
MGKKFTKEEFIAKATIRHGNLYDYSRVEYKNGDTKVEIICSIHGPFFQTPRHHHSQGTGCPYCSGQKVHELTCLATLRPDIAQQWHPTRNGELTPKDVTLGSHQKVWWKCPNGDDHEWEIPVYSRTGLGRGCPVCSGRLVVSSNCLATLRPDIAQQWHPTRNGELTPKDVTVGSRSRVWWKCPNGDDHEWEIPVYSRTRGDGCPRCNISRGEKTIGEILKKYNIPYDQEIAGFKNLKDIGRLRFDFGVVLRDILYLIEYQGIQHYKQTSRQTVEEFQDGQKRDALKVKFCEDNKFPLLRIPYQEFDNIEQKLCEFLNIRS